MRNLIKALGWGKLCRVKKNIGFNVSTTKGRNCPVMMWYTISKSVFRISSKMSMMTSFPEESSRTSDSLMVLPQMSGMLCMIEHKWISVTGYGIRGNVFAYLWWILSLTWTTSGTPNISFIWDDWENTKERFVSCEYAESLPCQHVKNSEQVKIPQGVRVQRCCTWHLLVTVYTWKKKLVFLLQVSTYTNWRWGDR